MPKNPQTLNTGIGQIKPREITEEMRESYIDYAMSVIVSRALPDVRDGLKPVHRRILYAMNEMGLKHNAKSRKSATVVGECFVQGTLISTEKGLLPIQEIQTGDQVYTQNGLRKVIQLYEMSEKPLLKVILDNGISNIVTPSQKFKVLTENWEFEWKRAEELTDKDYLIIKADYPEGNKLARLKKTEENQSTYLNENIAYFLGMFISEGSISNDYSKKKLPRIVITNNSREIIEKIVSILDKEFNYKATIEVNNYKFLSASGEILNNIRYSVRINRKIINEFFASNFGLANTKALTKEIPQQIFVSPKEIIYAFISGLIDGDGSIHKNRNAIHYGSISEKLINQLQILLLHQGIFTQKYQDNSQKSHYMGERMVHKRQPFYYLEVRGENAAKLASKLSLTEKVRSSRALILMDKEFTSYDRKGWNRYDLIPYAGKILFQELSKNHIGSGWYQDINGDKFRTGIKYPDGCKIRYSFDLWEKPLRRTQVIDWGIKEKLNRIGSPLFEFLEHIIENKIYFIKVKYVEKAAPQKTYDFEVANNHEFVANGIVSHNCLGKYHPHGDQAVYDAAIRMAQDFILRYPLIQGQGNFGCFTKDTKVRLCDGRNLSLEELINEQKKGKKHWTFTFNHQTKEIEITEIKNPRLTRKKEKIIEVTLDNGEKIKCTLDHQFMLRDGNYREAKNLNPGDSLMPLYTKLYEGEDRNLKEYETIYQPIRNRWDFIHRLADKWNLRHKVYTKSAGRIRHHRDFNKLNNSPDNVLRIQWQDHWKYHKEIASERHRKDPEYVKRIAEGRKKYFSKKENIEFHQRLRAERNKIMWQNPKYRKIWIEARKEMWKDPEYKEFMRKASSKNLKNLWRRKDFQKLMSSLKSEEMKERWQNEDYRKLMAKRMRQLSLKLWSIPAHRKYISELMIKKFGSLEARKRASAIMKSLWQTPEYRAKYPTDHFVKMAKKLWEDPKMREFYREQAIQQWQDPRFRKKIIKAVRVRNIQRTKENPSFMKELTEKAKISLRRNWKNPQYKEKVVKSKILGYVYSLLKNHSKVTPEIYEKKRINNGIPKISNAFNYFNSFSEIVEKAQKYNHKVIKTKILQKREDVYDLTTEPWHNFLLGAGVFVHNSIDDPGEFAAMRYTEMRLSRVGEEMLKDIEKNTVDFADNYDGTRKEPVVLPSPAPQLLLNGSLGIAVGMATNIPPHNLNEVTDALIYLIDHPRATTEDLFKFIKGPDFPTAGQIFDQKTIIEAYSQGKGPILTRGKTEVIEREKTDRQQIIISEIPFQVQKSALVEQFANLVSEKKIEGIKDIRDESDKEGMRIVIDLQRDAYPQKILNRLYKFSDLQKTFHLNMLALVEGIQPRVLNLPDLLNYFISHRKKVVFRRTRFELEKARERAHILEGLHKCLARIDEVIQTIKNSASREDAQKNLIKRFKLTQIQANAILETRLAALAKLERKKIEDELKEQLTKIKELSTILKSPQKIKDVIKKELSSLKESFADIRKTKVIPQKVGEIAEEDLIPQEETIITLTQGGYVKRINPSQYKIQKRGGKGILGMKTIGEDIVEHFLTANTHDNLLFFTDSGKVFQTPVYEIPEGARVQKGRGLLNFLEISSEEKVLSLHPSGKADQEMGNKYLVMATKDGIIKKTALEEFENVRRSGLIAITLKKGDLLRSVRKTTGEDEIVLVTKKGQTIRFKEKEVRTMGRTASGVKGIKLRKGDEVIAMDIVNVKGRPSHNHLLVVTENGYGKRTDLKEYRLQGRGGAGIKAAKIVSRTGNLAAAKVLTDEEDLIVISQKGQVIRTEIKLIATLNRATQGVRIMKLEEGDKVASATCI